MIDQRLAIEILQNGLAKSTLKHLENESISQHEYNSQ